MPIYPVARGGEIMVMACWGPDHTGPQRCPRGARLRASISDPVPHLCKACSDSRVAKNHAAFQADLAARRREGGME
jgi:hypothetical protein